MPSSQTGTLDLTQETNMPIKMRVNTDWSFSMKLFDTVLVNGKTEQRPFTGTVTGVTSTLRVQEEKDGADLFCLTVGHGITPVAPDSLAYAPPLLTKVRLYYFQIKTQIPDRPLITITGTINCVK